jgi:hypothetical protein
MDHIIRRMSVSSPKNGAPGRTQQSETKHTVRTVVEKNIEFLVRLRRLECQSTEDRRN